MSETKKEIHLPQRLDFAPKNLWDVFPDYTLSPNLTANDELIGTLKKAYAPKAIRIRDMFLSVARMRATERAEAGDEKCNVNIEDNLFQRAGQAMEAHLRNCSLDALKLFNKRKDESHPSLKFSALFKPRATFSPEAWETMTALLAAVWGWAERWHLNHYVYVHLACLALVEGHWVIIHDPFPMLPSIASPPSIFSSPQSFPHFSSFGGGVKREETPSVTPIPFLFHPQDPRERDDFISLCTPGVGWHSAQWSILSPALTELNSHVPKPPKGFSQYRGAYRGAVDQKAAQEKYVELCQQETETLIESTFLANLGTTLREKIIEEMRDVAKKHCAAVDSDYNRRRETMPGRYWKEYDRNIKWAVERVILQRSWQDIAAESKKARERTAIVQSRIKQAVRRMLPQLQLPVSAAFFGTAGRRKIGTSAG